MELIDQKLSAILRKMNPEINLSELINIQLKSIELVSVVAEIEEEFKIELNHSDIKMGLLKDYKTTLEIIKNKIEKGN